MKLITIKIISIDKDKIVGQKIGCDKGDDENYDKNKIIDIPLSRNLYIGMLTEMKRANIPMDDKLKCFNDNVFTLSVENHINPPKITLRKDIEQLYENSK